MTKYVKVLDVGNIDDESELENKINDNIGNLGPERLVSLTMNDRFCIMLFDNEKIT
jgi:hypothetical protein